MKPVTESSSLTSSVLVTRKHKNAQKPILVLGICRPALTILSVAYLLLAISAVLHLLNPASKVAKFLALVAYIMVASLFLWKAYKDRGKWGSTRKGRGRHDNTPSGGANGSTAQAKKQEAAGSAVTHEPQAKPATKEGGAEDAKFSV